MRTTKITEKHRKEIADALIERMTETHNEIVNDIYKYLRLQVLDPAVSPDALRKTCMTMRDHAALRMHELANEKAALKVLACESDKYMIYHFFLLYIGRYR